MPNRMDISTIALSKLERFHSSSTNSYCAMGGNSQQYEEDDFQIKMPTSKVIKFAKNHFIPRNFN